MAAAIALRHGWNAVDGERDAGRTRTTRNGDAQFGERFERRFSARGSAPRTHRTRVSRRRNPHVRAAAIRHTGRALDLALLGPGEFRVGAAATRNGAFVTDRDGWLTDDRGRRVAGTRGPIAITARTTIAADGDVRANGRSVNRIPLPPGTHVQTGALETSNVDAIGETLAILNAQRAYETAQKVLVAIDDTRQKAVNDVGRLK